MKELITKYLEKLICIAALLGVCIGCVLAMVLHLENEKLDTIKPSGKNVIAKVDPKDLVDPSVKLKETNDAFDGSIYVYCRNPLCTSLVNVNHERCKKCNTSILKVIETGGRDDDDYDLIPNKIEIRENMDPKNPADAAEDRDHDGFSNFDELITFDGKAGCIDDDKDHPPFIALYGAIKAPVKPLPFKILKIDIAGPKDTWQVQLQVDPIGKSSRVRKTTRAIADKESIGENELLNYTLKDIAVDETDPENKDKMKLTFENGNKEQVVAELGKEISPPKSFKVDFSDGKKSFSVTQIGEKFTIKGPNNEIQNYILRDWDSQKSVAKVFCQEDKTESDVGAMPAVKCPVKKQ